MRFHYVESGRPSVQSPELYNHRLQILGLKVSQHKPAVRASVVRCAVLILLSMTALSSIAQQVSGGSLPVPTHSIPNHAAIVANYGKLPLSFEKNQGQIDPQVRFLSRGNGHSLFLTDSAAVLSLRKPEASPFLGTAAKPGIPPRLAPKPAASFKTDVVRMELDGASRGLQVVSDSRLAGTSNYFIGNDPAKWHSAVPTYARVKYDQV